jgi:hypothetical protein
VCSGAATPQKRRLFALEPLFGLQVVNFLRHYPILEIGIAAMAEVNPGRGQVDRNYATFKSNLRDLLAKYPGKQVLLHDGEIVEVFDTLSDAVKFGNAKFGVSNYSVQEVTNRPAELGWHSHAVHYTPI